MTDPTDPCCPLAPISATLFGAKSLSKFRIDIAYRPLRNPDAVGIRAGVQRFRPAARLPPIYVAFAMSAAACAVAGVATNRFNTAAIMPYLTWVRLASRK